MGSPVPLSGFDPDVVSTSDFPWVPETVIPQVASHLLVTPYFGLVAAVFCEVDDTDVLCEVQELMIEPLDTVQFASGAWTVPEVIGYMNKRQNDFIKRTSILQRRKRLNYIPETHRVDLPQDLVVIRRLYFKDLNPQASLAFPIARGDSWEEDQARPDWEYNPDAFYPAVYTDGEGQQLQAALMPGTKAKGVVEALYVPLGVPLDGTGVCFTVSEEFTPTIRWGVLEDMLIKVGHHQDPERAAYCGQRYEEGVGAANLMLGGWA